MLEEDRERAPRNDMWRGVVEGYIGTRDSVLLLKEY